MLTIVMYHYVRDPERTPFPRIRARRTGEFAEQLGYLIRHHTVVGLDDVRAAYAGEANLPPAACLLTFDDGLIDHAETVVPLLRRRGLRGCFCVPAQPVQERRVLDVQKSQFALAAAPDAGALSRRLLEIVAELRTRYPIPPDHELRARLAHAGRYDDAETAFVKRLLQDGLPDEPRQLVLDQLFAEFVSDDERAFAGGLYLSEGDVRELVRGQMDVAGHGFAHRRLGLLAPAEQRDEIERTRHFLEHIGGATADWTMCYPYGDRSPAALRVLHEHGCTLGLTTDVGLARQDSPPLELPRLDTNDVPVDAGAPPTVWTRRAA